MRGQIIFLISLALMACSSRQDLAPVEESHWRKQVSKAAVYYVRPGDTLFAIAFRYDRDYRALAEYNHLQRPYHLRLGQRIQIPALYPTKANVSSPMTTRRVFTPTKTSIYTNKKPSLPAPSSFQTSVKPGWVWPARGRISNQYMPEQGKKGIDIVGKKGDKVKAAASGVVAYSGNGLTGYGNLIIIKHDNQILTAYGNNLKNRVIEGQSVKAGQIIADMGIVNRQFWGVHFEIRKAGQPVNPSVYLQWH